MICSEFLYRHFPEHHEGHLSLLRSSLVNNRTQAVVCDDLGMTQYAVYSNPKADLKTKDRADLLEAFLGALYVDQGLEHCQMFCQVCLFPRLQDFIMNQDWNDPKSKLQQCCLTLRTMDGGEPDIPVYKVIECSGPTNTRVYTVAVYFRGTRLAAATGHSIQQAEMNAAKQGLEKSQDLFPQLDHQKRVIAQSIKRQRNKNGEPIDDRTNLQIEQQIMEEQWDDISAKIKEKSTYSNLPKQYRPRGSSADESDDDIKDIGSISSLSSFDEELPKKRKKKKSIKKSKNKHTSESFISKTSSIANLLEFTEDITSPDEQSDGDDQSTVSLFNDSEISNQTFIHEHCKKTDLQVSVTDNTHKIDTGLATISKSVETSDTQDNHEIDMKKPVQSKFDNYIQGLKLEGVEDLSSDLESGEIDDI